MKHMIFGLAGVLAVSTALPAFATAAPAMQNRTTEVVETSTSRTVVVSESKLFGQQIAAELDGVENASIFRNLVAQNGLGISLRDNGKGYTAFVPVNSALSGVNLAPAAEGKFNPEARAIIEDHVVDSKFDVNLLHGQRDSITSLSGKKIVVSKAGKSFYANGNLIVSRQHSPEGIIYFIQSPLGVTSSNMSVYNPADASK